MRRRARMRWLVVLGLSVALLALIAQPAAASQLVPQLPIAGLFDFLNPLKGIGDLVGKVVGKLFGALAKALMPDFLKRATVRTLEGLVAIPNLSNARQWHNVGELRGGTTAIGWALLPLPFTIATLRYLVGTFTDGPHPINAVMRLVGAAFGLVIYPFAAGQAFAFVNVLTHSLLSLPPVGNGLQRAVAVLFGAAIIAGLASPFLAVLALIAIVLGTLLFALKVAVLMIAALLYVAGPLVIALYPLQETSHLYRAWLFAFVALAMVPVGWCLIFAVAGALTLDATSGGVSAGLVAKDVTAALAAILAFGIAVLWPKVLISHALQVASGLGVRLRGVGGTGASTSTAPRAQAAVRQLRDGALTVGRSVGRAMGHLGAPAGGAAGWAGRVMARTTPVAAAAGAVGAASGALGARVAGIRDRAAAGEGGRFTRAGAELAAIPSQLRGDQAPVVPVRGDHPNGATSAARGPAAGSRPGRPRKRLDRPTTPEQRAVLSRLPRDAPRGVRQAVIRAAPGSAAHAAARAARDAGAPLSAEAHRAVFAAGDDAFRRTPGADVHPTAPVGRADAQAPSAPTRSRSGRPTSRAPEAPPTGRPPTPPAPAPPAPPRPRDRGDGA